MGSIISAIYDDMNEYERLCERYGEKPQYKPDAYGNMLLDCYGKHATKLEKRRRDEWEAAYRARQPAKGGVQST